MRSLAVTVVALGLVLTAGHARAQTYDPAFPVCLNVVSYGVTPYYRCTYMTMEQCRATANGQMCVMNPYYASAAAPARKKNQRYRGQVGSASPASPKPPIHNRAGPCSQGKEAYYGACQGYAPGEKEQFLQSVRQSL